MLLILMYHQIIDPNIEPEISINKFEEHLKYLQQNFNIVLPGQNLLKYNVCLTFDDAYADFYHYVFPVLRKLNIPAVLAIPTSLIAEITDIATKQRLSVSYPEGITATGSANAALCTWDEIRKMVSSRLVYPGSHTLSHKNLATINFNEAYQEICVSKRNILTKLETITEVLIYPFGAFNNNIQNMANSHYRYVMRIGNASNRNWNQKILYRINADHFWKNHKKFSKLNFLFWKIKYLFNLARGK